MNFIVCHRRKFIFDRVRQENNNNNRKGGNTCCFRSFKVVIAEEMKGFLADVFPGQWNLFPLHLKAVAAGGHRGPL